MKVALIQLWFGPLPEYFNYHLETTKNIDLIDFYFFTDQDLDIKQDNFFYHKILVSNILSITYGPIRHVITQSNYIKIINQNFIIREIFIKNKKSIF